MEKSQDIKWVFISDQDTAVSRAYLAEILQNHASANTIIGRIGCIPTSYTYSLPIFQMCHKYPILQSGIAISIDLVPKIKNITNKIEYDIGITCYTAQFYDDFKFQFLPATSEYRPIFYLASFYPSSSSSLPQKYLHVSGIKAYPFLSPFAQGELTLGSKLQFMDTYINATIDKVFQFKCSDSLESNITIVPPPEIFSLPNIIEIRCFNET